MPSEPDSDHVTLALNTKLEQDFVAPLTAARGALEILRDFPDLDERERARFVTTALESCLRLEAGVDDLASTVYAAGQKTYQSWAATESVEDKSTSGGRIHVLETQDIIEVDFQDFEASSSTLVNEFYDALEAIAARTGRRWYFLVNYSGLSVWPEAWVAFAHRGKKINVGYSIATVRYMAGGSSGWGKTNPDMYDSRAAAIAHIEDLRAGVDS